MLPSCAQNFETTKNPYKEDTSWVIECLFCYKTFKPQTISKDKIKVEILSDLFSTFCNYMKWESPEEHHQFDFRKEQFPFCSSCRNELVRVFKLDEQIQIVIADVISKIIYSQKPIPKKKRKGALWEKKAEFYRRQTIVQHQQYVLLEPVVQVEPAGLDKDSGADVTGQRSTAETKSRFLASAAPFISSSPRNPPTAVPPAKEPWFKDRVQHLGRTKFIYDNKYLFTRSKNRVQCLACDESYSTKFDLLLHWETGPCFSSQQPLEIIEAFPSHTETVPKRISSAQNPEKVQRDEMSSTIIMKSKCQPTPQKEDRRTFGCIKCHVSFKRKDALQRHLISLHGDESFKTFPCQLCSETFASNSLLKAHMRRHRQKPCSICGKIYNIYSISRHKKEQHGAFAFSSRSATESTLFYQSPLTKMKLSKHLKRRQTATASSDNSVREQNKS